MPSQSYCVIENTNTDAWQCVEKLEDLVQNGEEINEYEQKRLKSLIEACRQIVAIYEEGIEEGIIDENGALIDADNDDDEEDEHPYLDRHEDKE
jgi:hypothetical protein